MRKVIPLAVAGGVLVASGGVFGVAQALAKDVEVVQDGVPTKVRTWDKTVGEVLEGQKITIGEHDLVAPSLSEVLADEQEITVRYGRQLRLTIDGQPETVWTTALTLDEALAERSIRDESRMSTSRNAKIGREGLVVNIETAKKVTLVSGGEPKPFVTPAETVGEALAEAQVEVRPEDRVEPAIETPIAEDMTITVHKNDAKETTKAVDIPFKTVRKETPSLPKGKEQVEREGVNGKAVETWVERFENGKSVKNEKTATRVEKEPVDKVVLVGTGSTPTPTPKASSSPSRSSSPTKAPSSAKPEAKNSGSADLSPAQGSSCLASHYSDPQVTAWGEMFNPNAMTTAHKTLPRNTRVKVTNPKNNKSVIVTVTDRGPYVSGRCLDLSTAAFSAISSPGAGVIMVNYQVL